MYSKLLTMFGFNAYEPKFKTSPICRSYPSLFWGFFKIEELVKPEVKKPNMIWNIGKLCIILLISIAATILIMDLYKRWMRRRIIAQFKRDGIFTQDVVDIYNPMIEKELLLQNRGLRWTESTEPVRVSARSTPNDSFEPARDSSRNVSNDTFESARVSARNASHDSFEPDRVSARNAPNDSIESALDTQDSDSSNDIETSEFEEIDEITDNSEPDPEPIEKPTELPKRRNSALPVPKMQICTSSAHRSSSTTHISAMKRGPTFEACFKYNRQSRATTVQVSQKPIWRF